MKNLTLPIIYRTDEEIYRIFTDDAFMEQCEIENEKTIDQWMDVIESENFTALEVSETGKNGYIHKLVLSDFNGQIRISYFSIENGKLFANMHENYDSLRKAAEKLARYGISNVILN